MEIVKQGPYYQLGSHGQSSAALLDRKDRSQIHIRLGYTTTSASYADIDVHEYFAVFEAQPSSKASVRKEFKANDQLEIRGSQRKQCICPIERYGELPPMLLADVVGKFLRYDHNITIEFPVVEHSYTLSREWNFPDRESLYPPDWDSRRKQVYRRDGFQCQECGRYGGPRGDAELHAHHNTPIADGGSHDLSNLTTLCKDCHAETHEHALL